MNTVINGYSKVFESGQRTTTITGTGTRQSGRRTEILFDTNASRFDIPRVFWNDGIVLEWSDKISHRKREAWTEAFSDLEDALWDAGF